MKMFSFSLQDQIKALSKVGYVVVEQDVIVDESRSNTYKDEKHYANHAVYYKGKRLVEYLQPGTAEVEYAFMIELHNRMLKLFDND